MGFRVFVRVPDAAATRGQYLALIKALWHCFYLFMFGLVARSRLSCQLSVLQYHYFRIISLCGYAVWCTCV